MKKSAIWFLILLVLLLFLTATAQAEGGNFGNGLNWSLSDKGILTISGNGPIPDFADYFEYSNTSPWNKYRGKIKSVVIKPGVTAVGDNAFSDCEKLASVTLPDSVTRIGDYAFAWCYALKQVNLPEHLTTLGYCAFVDTQLTSVLLPAEVNELHWPFCGCDELIAINVDAANPHFSSVDGVLYNKDQTVLLEYPAAKPGDSFTVPSGVERIGGRAFYGCHLSSLTFSETVNHIDSFAFPYCQNLTEITIPGNIREIESNAFSCCNYLRTVRLCEGLESIGDNAFESCAIETIDIPASVTALGNEYGHPFSSCWSLREIRVEVDNPFYSSRNGVLFSKDMEDLVAFPLGKGQWTYNVPSTVRKIRPYAFSQCVALSYITLPQNLEQIEDFAFESSMLSIISVPASLKNVGLCAFRYCENLSDVCYAGNAEQWQAIIFDEENDSIINANIHYNAYWYYIDISIPSGVARIESEAFANIPDDSVVYIHDNVTFIADDAFKGVNGLVICGKSDSQAETFATDKGYTFVEQ